ncbi:MAG: histidinol-phosphatase HisJ family protein [Clostridia bacterium]|nr:histidinol-phosphatase HisJ family protein [Clostridia bacterium]
MSYQRIIDMHTHTANSFDGNHSAMYMCECAARAGLRALAFTDHVEIDIFEQHEFNRWARQSYFESIKARAAFLGKPIVYVGVELGEATYDVPTAEKLLNTLHYDFVIGSIHNLPGEEDFCFLDVDNTTDAGIREIMRQYFEEERKLAAWGKVDTIGHLTYPLRYICGEHGRKVDLRDYSTEIEAVLKAVIHSGIALEINTSGLFQQIQSTMPGEEVIALYRHLGGELITIGSDAHYGEHLGRGITTGMALARRCGFGKLTVFQDREPIQIPME